MVERFQARVSRVTVAPLVRHLLLCGGDEALSELTTLVNRNGFQMNAPVLKGANGETPLHIAAAVGNIRAVTLLLNESADPNVEDNIRETALEVAEENPAGFMKKDTKAV